MKRITQEDQREIESNYLKLNEYWYFDYKTKEIRRVSPKTRWGRFIEIFWKKRHTVNQLYWWIDRYFVNNPEETIVFQLPIKKDEIDINGFPTKYKLLGTWEIPTTDLKHLKDGPLANASGDEILVDHNIGLWKKTLLTFKQYGPIFTTSVALYAIINGICRNWTFILSFIGIGE